MLAPGIVSALEGIIIILDLLELPVQHFERSTSRLGKMTKISGRSILTNSKGWIPRFRNAHHTPLFDVFTMTAHDLQDELIAGRLRSTQVLEEYYRTICAHNDYLNAVFVLAPGAMSRAQEMDIRRAKGEFLGPLHGIPILIKVCIYRRTIYS
jgi:hypothetical protein